MYKGVNVHIEATCIYMYMCQSLHIHVCVFFIEDFLSTTSRLLRTNFNFLSH